MISIRRLDNEFQGRPRPTSQIHILNTRELGSMRRCQVILCSLMALSNGMVQMTERTVTADINVINATGLNQLAFYKINHVESIDRNCHD